MSDLSLDLKAHIYLSGGHFGESIGTFAHIQFFQEPSSPTQADAEACGICAPLRSA